jgi:hypothetical protein
MEENLVGYLFNSLDPDTSREVEKYLDGEPGARDRLEVLRRALAPLESDKDSIEPPSGLRIRALGRVAEYRCRPLPQAPEPPPARFVPSGRAWWRRADMFVAASLLVLIGGLGTTGIMHVRGEHYRKACADNLRLYHSALNSFADSNSDRLPYIAKGQPHHVAAAFAPMLKEAGVVPEKLLYNCPANGTYPHEMPTFHELANLSDEEFAARVRQLPDCYAYTLGYMDPQGQHVGIRRQPLLYNSTALPVMADCPSRSEANPDERGNSPNHHGQNVLYLGGNVRFSKTPLAGVEGDNIYLNREGKVAAGVDQWDAVLGVKDDRP